MEMTIIENQEGVLLNNLKFDQQETIRGFISLNKIIHGWFHPNQDFKNRKVALYEFLIQNPSLSDREIDMVMILSDDPDIKEYFAKANKKK